MGAAVTTVVDDMYKRANSEDHYVKCYLGSSPRLRLHCTVRVWKAGLINERAKVVGWWQAGRRK
jgi:hypothetical protein